MALIVLAASAALALGRLSLHSGADAEFSAPAPVSLVSDRGQADDATGFLENRVRTDPGDALLYNKLGGYYLQDLRETGALQYLVLISETAHASLASVPVIRNVDGLSLRTLAEFSSHEFGTAKRHALELTRLAPAKGYPFEMLFDDDVELGDYAGAQRALILMRRHDVGLNLNTETREARWLGLHGDPAGSARHLANAIALGLRLATPPRESVAWSYWQLGETAFLAGDYAAAEQRYRDALTTFPGYYRALASLGRVRAARGDLPDAIAQYRAAIDILPDPTYVAALGDLYTLNGQAREASQQYALVGVIAHLSALAGVLYNRPLALFYADHDMKPLDAYAAAKREYAARKDIYGADAVAWTALKAGRVRDAQSAIREATRLGTIDARLYYHAGMIARALGDRASARTYLRRALALSPVFDPLQARHAVAVLGAM